MRRDRKKRATITKEEIQNVVSLLKSGKTYEEVGNIVNRSVGSINQLHTMHNFGFERLIDYLDSLVRRRGFSSFLDYNKIRNLVKNPEVYRDNSHPLTKQQKFEESLELSDKLEEICHSNEEIPGSKSHLDKEALMYSISRLKENRPKLHEAIIYYFYGNRDVSEIGNITMMTPQGASLRIRRGLAYLKETLDRKRVSG